MRVWGIFKYKRGFVHAVTETNCDWDSWRLTEGKPLVLVCNQPFCLVWECWGGKTIVTFSSLSLSSCLWHSAGDTGPRQAVCTTEQRFASLLRQKTDWLHNWVTSGKSLPWTWMCSAIFLWFRLLIGCFSWHNFHGFTKFLVHSTCRCETSPVRKPTASHNFNDRM